MFYATFISFYTFKLLKTIKGENPSITILTLNSYILPCPNTGENDIKTILIHMQF